MSAPPGLLAGRQGLREEETRAPPSWAPVRPPLPWVSEWPHGWALPADPPWHVAQARGVKPVRSGGALTDLSFSKPVTANAALSGPPADKQGSALCAEDASPGDRTLHVCVNEQLLFIKEKLATVSVHTPAVLILRFKVTVIHVLALNCQRHC